MVRTPMAPSDASVATAGTGRPGRPYIFILKEKENEKCFKELIQSSGMRKFKSHEGYPTSPQ
jgi:hypothetical protein